MTRRRPSKAIEPGSGGDAPPEDSGADAAFDAAQGLLNAALDEVRTSGSETSPPQGGAVPGTPGTTRRRGNPDGSTRRRGPADGTTRRAGTTATPTTEGAEGSAEMPERERRTVRRRSRRDSKEFAELRSIEALERDAAGGAGRLPPDDDSMLPDVGPVDEAHSSERASPGDPPARQPGTTVRDTARRPRGARLMLVAALVVIAIGVATLVAVSGDGTSGRSVPRAAPGTSDQIRLALDPVTTPDGVTIGRVWMLRGARGTRFVGRFVFSNPTATPLNVVHTEVIPKSLASSVDDITFDPQPTILEADPVVEYSVTVPASGTATARYEIEVAPEGRSRARLEAWADDARVAELERAASTTTTAPPSTPAPSPALPPSGPGTGAIVVQTIAQGVGGTFRYSGPGGTMISGNVQGSGQSPAIPVPVGVHTWTQVSAPPGSTLVGIGCNDSDSTGFGATANFTVQAGETVVCTWTNQ